MDDASGMAREVGTLAAVHAVFDALPVLACATEGPEHTFVAANAAYARFLNRTRLVGMRVRDAFPEAAGQQLFELLDEAYRSGEPADYRGWRVQFDRSGTGRLDEVYLDFQIAPLHGPDGAVRGLAITGVDVTERVLERASAQAAAEDAAEQWAAAHRASVQLQRALLPQGLPVLPRVRLAARYLVAAEEQATGGDWFDAVPRPDGTVAAVVGDVVGQGVAAIAAMGQLRAVLDELLCRDLPIEDVLARLDGLAARTPAMRASTVCLAVLDPRQGALRYATCGHPAPLLVTADTRRYLPRSGAGPLGAGAPLTVTDAVLPPAGVLLLYSDGLIERPGRSLTDGQATLAQVAADAMAGLALPSGASPLAAERVCELAVELLTRTGYGDDVTALAVERLATAVAPLHVDVRSDAQELRQVRRLLAEWLAPLAAESRADQALQLAVSELVANSVEHAYPPDAPGRVRVDAELGTDSAVTLCVADRGNWREPAGPVPSRGRGLWLVGAMVDEVRIEHPDGPERGTVVTVRQTLRHPARLAAEPSGAPQRPARVSEFRAEVDGSDHVRARGPVDLGTVDRFADRLRSASRGGLHPLTVDLSEVSMLGSVGVRVLYELRDALAVHGQPLTLVAPAGSPAQAVLDLVALPRDPGVTASAPTEPR